MSDIRSLETLRIFSSVMAELNLSIDDFDLSDPAQFAKLLNHPAFVEHCRSLEIQQRKRVLIDAGAWPLPEGWDSDLIAPDYIPLPCDYLLLG